MTADFDPARRYIRIVAQHANGMVEFEFAVGEPGLFVEMQLPQAAFADFCAMQGVQPQDADAAALAPSDLDADLPQADRAQHWTLHDAIARSSGQPPR